MSNKSSKMQRIWQFYQEQGISQLIYQKLLSRVRRNYHETRIYWTPRRLYQRLDRIKIERPIFLVGIHGGGLTLINRVLRRHPSVISISGNYKYWAGEGEMHKYRWFKNMPDAWTLRSPGYGNTLGDEKDHAIYGYARNAIWATQDMLPDYRMTEDNWTVELEEIMRKNIQMCLRAYAEDMNISLRYIDMSQSYALKIPLIQKCLPGSQFVLVSRDPYAMCWRDASVRTHKYRLWREKPTLQEGVRLAAEQYGNIYRIALSDIKDDKSHYIGRFEDFLKAPDENLRKIVEVLGIEYLDNMLPQKEDTLPMGSHSGDKWFPIRHDINNKYLDNVPAWACDIIEGQCGDMAEYFGYKRPR